LEQEQTAGFPKREGFPCIPSNDVMPEKGGRPPECRSDYRVSPPWLAVFSRTHPWQRADYWIPKGAKAW